jgi:membrane dipeptidase
MVARNGIRQPQSRNCCSVVRAVITPSAAFGIDHVGISSNFNHGGGVVDWENEGECQNVTAELLHRGYSEKDTAKLWGGNFLRVWAEAQKVGKALQAHQTQGP